VEGAGDPDGESDAEDEVAGVGSDDEHSIFLRFSVLNMFSY
jgi:hypothetical protein